MLQDEYYIIETENNDNYPLFSWNQLDDDFGMGKPAEIKVPVNMRLGDPINSSFEWVDYHEAPEPIVSKKITDVLYQLNIYGIQLVPAKVSNPKDPFAEDKDYWFIHVWNRIACLDKEKSKIRTNKAGTRIFAIDKLVLSDKTLSLFDIKKRLIFELTEDISVLLVHQSVKAAIESVNPIGCRFFSVADWRSDIVFE